jgi:23S rRNA (uracil1939-C5)-methyltransferase
LRSRFGEDGLSFGFYRAVQSESKWRKEFISWDTCPIHSVAIQETLENLRKEFVRCDRTFLSESLFGVWFGTPHLVIVLRDELPARIRDLEWEKILIPPLAEVSYYRTSQVGKTVFGEGGEIISLYRRTIAGKPMNEAPIRAFRQIARTLVGAARTRAIAELLRDRPPLLFDLYCGTGEISRLLPEDVEWIGIESSKDAVAFANTLRPVRHTAFAGFVSDRILDVRVRERVVGNYVLYLNPPRPGLGVDGQREVFSFIKERPPGCIAYLSCSASSLSRDLKGFTELGYEVENLIPYDFFPQTEHFETLAILRRKEAPRPD